MDHPVLGPVQALNLLVGAFELFVDAGIFNRTWEYIARPSTPQNFAPQYQAPPPTQQNYGNYVMATSSTIPQFSGPRFGQGSPANYSNYSGPVADGWRQRENFNGVPR